MGSVRPRTGSRWPTGGKVPSRAPGVLRTAWPGVKGCFKVSERPRAVVMCALPQAQLWPDASRNTPGNRFTPSGLA